jgi:hypothetical protein
MLETNAISLALDHPLAPVALSVISSFCFAFMDGTVQQLEQMGVPAGEIAFLRMVSAFQPSVKRTRD